MSNWPEKRASAAICYLDADVRRRGNLRIVNDAMVTGLLFDGHRANGVTATIGGETKEFHGRDIIVALGGIHSPAFLMRAGLGPAAALRELGIEVRADLPGVGENLSNHAIIFIGLLQKPGARQSAENPAASDDGVPLFLGPARRAAGRHVYQCAVQNVVEPARAPGRQSRTVAAQADGARPDVADRGRSGGLSARRVQFHRP